MEDQQELNVKYDFFSANQQQDVIIIRLGDYLMFRGTELSTKDIFLEYLDTIAANDSIKTIVIIGSPAKMGREEYIDFYRYAFTPKAKGLAVCRLFNAVNQLILKLTNMNKLVVHADSGRIIPIFMNISLACDYRIIADNTIYENPYLELGIAPKGGSVYFLSRLLGKSRALELLLSDKSMSAKNALELNIVDRVVPFEDLEENALITAQNFGKRPQGSLVTIKRLLNYPLGDLEEYLDFESQQLLRVLGAEGFCDELRDKTNK